MLSSSIELDETKKLVERHLRTELDVMELVMKLNTHDAKEFNEWYQNHPYRRAIEEIVSWADHQT